jgi:hypothetical protein
VCKERLARNDVEERGHGRQGSERSHGQEDVQPELRQDGRKVRPVRAAKKTVYELDDQQKPADFAGQNVRVAGSYDKATKTIHVTGIQAAP